MWWERLASTGSNSSRVLCWSSMFLSQSVSETRHPLRPLQSWESGTWRSLLQNICQIKWEMSLIRYSFLVNTVPFLLPKYVFGLGTILSCQQWTLFSSVSVRESDFSCFWEMIRPFKRNSESLHASKSMCTLNRTLTKQTVEWNVRLSKSTSSANWQTNLMSQKMYVVWI